MTTRRSSITVTGGRVRGPVTSHACSKRRSAEPSGSSATVASHAILVVARGHPSAVAVEVDDLVPDESVSFHGIRLDPGHGAPLEPADDRRLGARRRPDLEPVRHDLDDAVARRRLGRDHRSGCLGDGAAGAEAALVR